MEKESYRILVVDDDLRLRDLLKRYLGEQETQVGCELWHGNDSL